MIELDRRIIYCISCTYLLSGTILTSYGPVDTSYGQYGLHAFDGFSSST
jgi:hypothetical protein